VKFHSAKFSKFSKQQAAGVKTAARGRSSEISKNYQTTKFVKFQIAKFSKFSNKITVFVFKNIELIAAG
jgi:hypothetical protein